MIHASLLSDLSLQGAKVIITVMFSAIKYGDVSKQQLVSGAKKFKLSCNTTFKDSMALANTFLKENFVKIDSLNAVGMNHPHPQRKMLQGIMGIKNSTRLLLCACPPYLFCCASCVAVITFRPFLWPGNIWGPVRED